MASDEINSCVVYADIQSWTTQDFSRQVNTIYALFNNLTQRLKDRNLTPLWKTSTGDGFAILFQHIHAVSVIDLAADLHDIYMSENVKLRLAIASGPIFTFHSPLTNQLEFIGPALITGRRILDGITDGNVMLLDAALNRDVSPRLPKALRTRIFAHTDIEDKHGERHPVVQMLSYMQHSEKERTSLPSPTLQELAHRTCSEKIPTLLYPKERLDGLILHWMSHRRKGLEAVAVEVTKGDTKGVDLQTGLPGDLTQWVLDHRDAVKREIGKDNRKKVWIMSYTTPLTDRRKFTLEIGETDYLTTTSIRRSLDRTGGLRAEYETGVRDIHLSLPNMVVPSSVIVTTDNHVILAQRKPRNVDFLGGDWSVSFEEQWDPDKEKTPHETVLRGLQEEFNIDREHGIPISTDNLWLYALAREWGEFWSSVIIYVVRVDANAQKVLDCWSSFPPPIDKGEHVAVAAVPISTDEGRSFLLGLLDRRAEISKNTLLDVCGYENIRGNVSSEPHAVHSTTGRARILLALWSTGALN